MAQYTTYLSVHTAHQLTKFLSQRLKPFSMFLLYSGTAFVVLLHQVFLISTNAQRRLLNDVNEPIYSIYFNHAV